MSKMRIVLDVLGTGLFGLAIDSPSSQLKVQTWRRVDEENEMCEAHDVDSVGVSSGRHCDEIGEEE